MTLKKSLKDFSDRELLELMLFNQVQFERRLDRIDIYLNKRSDRENDELNQTHDYMLAAHNQDGRKEGYSFRNNFKELFDKSSDIKSQVEQLLKETDSEISW